MPELILMNGRYKPVATEAELIEFVNKVREAGGADVIDALFPSVKSEPDSCLIARALNFSCSVNGSNKPSRWGEAYPDLLDYSDHALIWKDDSSDHVWCMHVWHGGDLTSNKKAEEIAIALELPRVDNELLLPKPIGNAAQAFDDGKAFQKFAVAFLDEDE